MLLDTAASIAFGAKNLRPSAHHPVIFGRNIADSMTWLGPTPSPPYRTVCCRLS